MKIMDEFHPLENGVQSLHLSHLNGTLVNLTGCVVTLTISSIIFVGISITSSSFFGYDRFFWHDPFFHSLNMLLTT